MGSGFLVFLTAVSVVPGCAPGKYSPGTPGAAAACRLCPAGKYQPTRGARMCLMGCPRGTFKHGITCLPCAAGRFNRGLPPGSVSAQTVGACVLCPRGKHAATDAGGVGAIQTPVGDNSFVVIEKWASVDALKAHGASPHMAAYAAKVKDMLDGRVINVLE